MKRYTRFPGAGRPPALTTELEELVVLTYGAIQAANVERWALSFGAAAPPVLPGTMRVASYETDVVGTIHRMGQRYFERRNEAAVWERPFPTQQPGRPPAVDIALFNATAGRETRVEFGICPTNGSGKPTKVKLNSDAEKLHSLVGSTEPLFPEVDNYIVLWHEHRGSTVSMTGKRRQTDLADLKAIATDVTHAANGYATTLLMITCGALFPDRTDEHHWVTVGLFEVT